MRIPIFIHNECSARPLTTTTVGETKTSTLQRRKMVIKNCIIFPAERRPVRNNSTHFIFRLFQIFLQFFHTVKTENSPLEIIPLRKLWKPISLTFPYGMGKRKRTEQRVNERTKADIVQRIVDNPWRSSGGIRSTEYNIKSKRKYLELGY